MAKREENISKATAKGYSISKVGSMFFVNDNTDHCHGYFAEEDKALNLLSRIGKYL